ncbi:hypothetical protein GGS23DRAFT_187746 [Durotheca rogersii]|uniref:uncharacterized protein n=1 Tax=Durotheca rogersii TaxID=419775 RepID=UPI0022200C7B|nr:uncharacterized protein GGS23DRAFT_187746 [Durotheca rogersii]KAI5867662.1 hypothetical protein GGS23DRAFT_187746 [Durotheca rogersii]
MRHAPSNKRRGKQGKKHPGESERAETYDWNVRVLRMDFANHDWRLYDLDRVPWYSLADEVIDEVVRRHHAYDEANLPFDDRRYSPARREQIRRWEVLRQTHAAATAEPSPSLLYHSAPPSHVTAIGPEVISLVAPRPGTVDNPRDRTDEHRRPELPPAREKEAEGTGAPELSHGFITWGFELELPVAVAPAGGLLADKPHPRETRWQADIVTEDKEVFRQAAVAQMLQVLNSQMEGSVFVGKDNDEDDELYKRKVANLESLEADGAVSAGSERAAQDALVFAKSSFRPHEGRFLPLATEDDVERAVNRVPNIEAWGIVGAKETNRIYRRLTNLLRAEVYRARRDPDHVFLEGMKPRYRAFSVYIMNNVDLSAVKSRDYTDLPESNPATQYRWEVIKLASPVLRMQPQENHQVVQRLCRVLRNNFCIHKDLESIPVTTQITVSHTAGFDILEMKKVITLMAILGDQDIMRLHQSYRSSRKYDRVCGPLKTQSALGALSRRVPWIDGFDPRGVVPHPSETTRDYLLDQMKRYLPLDLLLTEDKLSDKIFYLSLWMYTNVDDISRAMNPELRTRKVEMVTKCSGKGPTTGPAPGEAEVQAKAKEVGWPLPPGGPPFRPVDERRGVFEFRQCANTLDASHLMSWATTCAAVVNFARNASAETFKDYVTNVLTGETSVLGGLGVPLEAQDFFRSHIDDDNGYFRFGEQEVLWSDPFYPPMP